MDISLKRKLDNFIVENYNELRKINDCVANYSTNISYKDDILQEIIVDLYNIDEKKLLRMLDKNQVLFYFSRMIYYSYTSNTSKFRMNYRQPFNNEMNIIDDLTYGVENEIDEDEYEKKILLINDTIENDLKWDEKYIFKYKLRTNKSSYKMSKEMNISYDYILSRYKKAVEKLKNKLIDNGYSR